MHGVSLTALRRLKTAVWHIRATWALGRARQSSIRAVQYSRPQKVLVVCYGNIYRSAFVGAWLSARQGSRLQVRSAGFHPVEARPSPARHVTMAGKLGVDLSRHLSACIRESDIHWADLIILMDRRNWISLKGMGASPKKLAWLGAWALDGGTELPDPDKMDDESAAILLDRLAACTASMYRDLVGNAKVQDNVATDESATAQVPVNPVADPSGSRSRSEDPGQKNAGSPRAISCEWGNQRED
jgi:protein-tyrosine-phosphatase